MPPSEEDIFQAVRRIESTEARREYLDHACGGDAGLRARVESLMSALESSESFLESPAPEVLGDIPTAKLPMTECLGDVIGPYKLLQQIGEGGFGVVYMADQERPVKRRVALKIIKAGMDTKAVIARFEAERQALALMDHPNIAKVLDAGSTESGRPYFVMELVKGISITEYCDEAKLDTRDRLKLFQDVCSAVHHAHQKGVIHRDLKPSNIMVTLHDAKPVVKVIDFGIAKATEQKLTEKTLFTNYGQMVGTPAYMSPEQAVISGLDIDTRSDIYSLGVLLYELLTGGPPFDIEKLRSAGFDEMRRIIREQEPPKPSTRLSTLAEETKLSLAARRATNPHALARQVEGDLDWVVMKALEKDRNRRYESASAFRADVQRHLDSEPVDAAAPSRTYQLRKFAQRNKGPMTAAALVACTLLIATGVSAWLAVRATQAEAAAASALQSLRATAPTYIERAEDLWAVQKADEALAAIDFALQLDPKNADYRLLQAEKLQALARLSEATASFQQVLELRPEDPTAEANLSLCRELEATHQESGRLPVEACVKLLAALQDQDRKKDLWTLQRRVGQQAKAARALILERSRHLHSRPSWREDRIRYEQDGQFHLDLSELPSGDLSWLEGLPVSSLELSNSSQVDFASLVQLPLKQLNLDWTHILTLASLQGMQLEGLSLVGTKISDLSPLSGMPLVELHLDRCLNVKDLAPLRGLPLQMLVLSGCDAITDFSPLVECERLERLVLPYGFRDVAAVRKLPKLDKVVLAGSRFEVDWNSLPPAEVYLELVERRVASESEKLDQLHAALRDMGVPEHKIAATRFNADRTLSLDLSDYFVEDLSPLAGVPVSSLTMKRPSRNDIESLRPLEDMPLYHLTMEGGHYDDLTPLRTTGVRYLDICSNKNVTSIEALRGNRNLRRLHLKDVSVTDLSPLAGCDRLTTLNLTGSPVRDLSPLAGLRSLEDFHFPRTLVDDLAPIRNLKLRTLYLDGSRVADLSPLREMTSLVQLHARLPQLKDVSPLSNLTSLRFLDLEDSKVTNIQPLEKLQLRILKISHSEIADLKPLRNMTSLEDLAASRLPVKDLSPLAGPNNLRMLYLSGVPAKDATPLAELPLNTLYLDESGIEDVSPLRKCETLEHLLIPRGATGVEALRDHPRLERLSYDWDSQNFRVSQTVEEFWAEYDATHAE